MVGDFAVVVEVPAVAEAFLSLEPVFTEDLEFFFGKAAAFVGVVEGEVFGEGAISKGALLGGEGDWEEEDGEEKAEHGFVSLRDVGE